MPSWGAVPKEQPSEMQDKTFRWFTEHVFIPDRKPRWRETTESPLNYYLEGKLYPVFGDTANEGHERTLACKRS